VFARSHTGGWLIYIGQMALAFGVRRWGRYFVPLGCRSCDKSDSVFLFGCRVVRLSRACSHHSRDSTRRVRIFLLTRSYSTPQCPKEVSFFILIYDNYFSTTKSIKMCVYVRRTAERVDALSFVLTFFVLTSYTRLSAIAAVHAWGYVGKCNKIMCFFRTWWFRRSQVPDISRFARRRRHQLRW